MTVAELKELLSSMPDDAKVYYDGGEYIEDDWRSVGAVKYRQKGERSGLPDNTVLIKGAD